MPEHEEPNLSDRVTVLEDFVSGMPRDVIYTRGEAMAATFCPAEFVTFWAVKRHSKKFSMGEALVNADAALDKE